MPVSPTAEEEHLIDSRERQDLVDLGTVHAGPARRPPRRRHADGIVPVLAIVAVHLLDGQDSWIGHRRISLPPTLRRMPVLDPAGKWTDEVRSSLGRGGGLEEAEHQGDVALDSLLLQYLASTDSLPRARNLDEEAVGADAQLLVHGHDAPGPLDGGVGVVRKADVHLGRNPTFRDDVANFLPEVDGQPVDGKIDRLGRLGTSVGHAQLLLGVRHRLLHQGLVAGVAVRAGLADEEGIGRGVGDAARGGEMGNVVEVSAVDGEGGQASQCLESIAGSRR